ncbi:thioredoxin [Planctomicrobium sp. SH527]|uniref:thioredoxin n=1 Tax=Planctomicrobium sp. SH527 TaxID=3448123 RepID=UPI003F5C61C6
MARQLIVAGIVALSVMTSWYGCTRIGSRGMSVSELAAVQVNDADFQKEVFESPQTVLVDFGATWCGPCQILNKTLDEVQGKYGEKLKIVKIDVDEKQDLAAAYKVEAIPFVMVVKQGKVVAADVGAVKVDQIERLIQPHLN